MFSSIKLDPELEKLRDEVCGPPNLDIVLLRIQRLSSQIHASYLFTKEGKPILQKICLLLSATATGKMYSDWQDFAAHLGLLREQIQCIDHNFKGFEDSTYYVLLAYIQFPEATLDKILTTLIKIDRLDIINRIRDTLTDFITNIFSNKSTDRRFGNIDIFRPTFTPRAPLVLSPMLEFNMNSNEIVNSFQGAPHTSQNNAIIRNAHRTCGSLVMLTFANDGAQCVNHITKIFRSMVPKVGVLVLNQQEKSAYCKGVESEQDCFKQANYIIPILTKDYIHQINTPVGIYNQDCFTLDTKYLKYVYSLLKFEYVKEDFYNNRVRCIVPDNQMKNSVTSDLHPTLQAWFKESDIKSFAERIRRKRF